MQPTCPMKTLNGLIMYLLVPWISRGIRRRRSLPDVRNLELKREQLINDKSLLQIKINQLTHINRIEKLAREKFGLIAPGKEIEQLVIKQFRPPNRTDELEDTKKLKLAGVQ